MAHGRILSKDICDDKRVNDLSSDICRLAFSWAITHLDRDGRMAGDPAVVKSKVFPRREDISTEQMAAFITEWRDKGLVVWYEAEGDRWLFFPRFRKHQPGLRYEQEAPSRIPSPPGERRDNGVTTVKQLPNGREGNISKENTGGDSAPQANSAVKRLIDHYFDRYVQKADQKPTVTGQWGRNLKTLLRAHTEETVQRVMDYFFDYPKRTQWGWNKFMSAFDNLLPGATGKTQHKGPAAAREWTCTVCGRVNNHVGSYCLTPRCEGEPGGKQSV